MEKVITVSNIKKSYGDVEAVRGIDFYVDKGTLFAFLGPNGAGKSTTIEIICTLLKQDEGEVDLLGYKLGKDDNKIRKNIGVLFQDGVLDKLLSVKDNLMLRGGLYGMQREDLNEAISQAVEYTGCTEFINRPYGKLSGGQKRRADIARALVNSPQILFFDEPTTGLDPHTRLQVWQTIKKLQKETDMTVFLTTHYMEEAAEADYVAVIDKGLITAKGTPSELREKYSKDFISVKAKNEDKLKETLLSFGTTYTKKGDLFIIELENTLSAIPIIELIKDNITILEVKSGSMDEAFINITGGIV
ncbi:MAG: ABC transporter ATP-binding protein [Clostridia bacterium]|nr:ABC transporter ATP-binding protein [Clostridia bacterium]